MNKFISFIHLLALVVWLGSIIFFSFFAAPAIFRTLDRPQAGDVIGAIFPKYYAIGYVCGALTAGTLIISPNGLSGPRLAFVTLMMACTLYAGLVINPQARALKQQLRAAPESDRETLETRFRSLHAWSVRLNSSVLILGLGLLWITAMGLRL